MTARDHKTEIPASLIAPIDRIERHLGEALDGFVGPSTLTDAMRYATVGGGKRLRPLVCWHACAAAGGDGEESLAACTALELVHCFSLVHDDLPALDDDDLRRGKPTLHRHAGEATAILAGDALLSHAFSVLASGAPADRAREFLGELAIACERMISGQVLDTLGWGDAGDAVGDLERLERMHRGKTGAMLIAAARLGAMSSPGHTEAGLEALTSYGDAIGLMFQVVDDVIDVTGDASHTGKRTGKDSDAGKLTYPGLLGIDGARSRVSELLGDAERALAPLGERAEPLRLLGRYLATRTR